MNTDVPGKAKCIVCDKIISYGARGRISLTEHCKSNEHAEKLKIKADNYTLGVPRPTVNHFSCSLIIFYTFDPICMRGTFMKYLVKVFIFTVQAELILLKLYCLSIEIQWFICFNFVQCKINCSCKLNFLQFNFPKK